ncbi:speckle targeted PIP5K1A-regulated poly(A) polymerase [Pelodytes ibericus]
MEVEENRNVPALPKDVQSTDRGGFRCLLCGISIPNQPSLSDHLRGKRHMRLCEERDKRQQQQERSVYVSGFPRDTTEEQLMDVFQQISPVKSIVMDKDRGLYAIVEFECKDGVSKSLTDTPLKLGEKRLRVKPREKKEFQRKKGGGTRNLQPPDPETLSKELVQCTDVDDQMKSVVSLCSPSHYESRLRELLLSLLQETFTEFFPGCQLLPFGSSVNGFEISGCDLDLYLELGESDDVAKEERLEGEKEVEGRKTKEALEESIEDDHEESEGESKLERNSMEESDKDDEEDVTPGLSLHGLSSEEVLELVEKVLRRCVPGVHGVQSVPSARRPVIRFQHKTSGLRGDITLNNRLALRNSSFLRLCSDMDSRVPQLVYTVRYWARVHQLAGNPLGGGPLLNNYALTLLVIFFLQTRSPPVIPTLCKMREEAVNEVPLVIDGWDCTFPSDTSRIQASSNDQSLSCLLPEFFSFFSSLDLSSLVLCPHNGSIQTLPPSSPIPSWLDDFRVGPLNIQDPFELSHNVCGNVSSRTARRFHSRCTNAAQNCRTSLYRLRSRSRPWGITLLLLPAPSDDERKGKVGTELLVPLGNILVEDACTAVRKVLEDVLLCTSHQVEESKDKIAEEEKAKDTNTHNNGEETVLEEEQLVPCKMEYTEKQGTSEDQVKYESPRKKRERTEQNIEDTMTKKMRIEESGKNPWIIHQANIDTQNGTPSAEHVHLLNVCVWHPVWEGRRKERRRLRGGEAKGAELETAISRALSLGKGDDNGEQPLMKLTAKVQLTAEAQTQLILTSDFDPNGHSPIFFHFLEGFLPRMVKTVLGTGE